MVENNVPDPWSVNVTENNIGTPIKTDKANTLTISSNFGLGVGFWRVDKNFRIYAAKRPNRLNRLMTKFLLGWEWVDT